MPNTPNQNEALQRIRQKLYLCAAIALKHDLDLSAELFRIFGSEAPATPQSMIETVNEKKAIVSVDRLEPRERLVLETIYESSEPVSIDEMLDKFKDNKDTRCSRVTLTTSVRFLKMLDLITQTCVDDKTKYAKVIPYGTFEP